VKIVEIDRDLNINCGSGKNPSSLLSTLVRLIVTKWMSTVERFRHNFDGEEILLHGCLLNIVQPRVLMLLDIDGPTMLASYLLFFTQVQGCGKQKGRMLLNESLFNKHAFENE